MTDIETLLTKWSILLDLFPGPFSVAPIYFYIKRLDNKSRMQKFVSILIPILGILAGMFAASCIHWTISEELLIFLAVGFIITVNTLFEGMVQYWNGIFRFKTSSVSYALNLFFAFFLLLVGHLMRVDLYIALFIVFGIKLFSNLSYISQRFFSKLPI